MVIAVWLYRRECWFIKQEHVCEVLSHVGGRQGSDYEGALAD